MYNNEYAEKKTCTVNVSSSTRQNIYLTYHTRRKSNFDRLSLGLKSLFYLCKREDIEGKALKKNILKKRILDKK